MAIPFDQRYTLRPSYFFKGVFKHCHSLSGAIYARLFSLQCTREGCTGTCYTTIPHLEDEFGEKEYAITQALKRLKDCGLISTQIEKWSQGKRTRVFFNLHHEYLYEDADRGNLKIKVSGSPENQGMGSPDNQATLIGGSPENQGMGSPENQGQDTEILSTEYLGTDFVGTDGATAPQSQKPTPPHTSKNKTVYPTCKEQCYGLFAEQYQELVKDYPELEDINVNCVALRFFNYYSPRKWKDNRGPILSVEKKAQNWLIDEIEKKAKRKNKTYKTKDEQQAEHNKAAWDLMNQINAENAVQADFEIVGEDEPVEKLDSLPAPENTTEPATKLQL